MYVACYRIFQFNLAHINLTWQSFESGDSHTEIPTFPQEPEPIGDDDGERSESPEPEPIDDGDAENGDLGVENEAETEEDSEGSDSMGEEWKQGAAPHDFKAEPIFPEPMFPDNQLGLWRWPDDVPGGGPSEDLDAPDIPSPSPEPETSQSPTSKRKAFWKKFVVPWPRPIDEKNDDNDGDSDSKSNDSSEDSHRDSETLSLSPTAGIRSLGKDQCFESESESDSESGVSSPMSMVEPEEFEKAMGEESERHHKNAMMGTLADKSTLETPKSERPAWWGFPMVSTPPKVSVTRLSMYI